MTAPDPAWAVNTKTCKIVGPYLPVGDDEWRCVTHNVEARLKSGIEPGHGPYRREELECPRRPEK